MTGATGDRSVTVAVCQLAPVVGEPDANREAAGTAIRAAAAAGAGLVVVPELVDSGYVFADREEAAALAEPAAASATLRAWRALAVELGIVIVGGWCEAGDDGELHNSAAIVDPGGVRATYRKAHLWDREKLVFTAGSAPPPVVATAAGRIAVCVCYDLEFAEWSSLAARAGAEILAVPVNWPATTPPPGERPAEVVKAQAAAAANAVYVAVADRCGTERGVAWTGGSVIVGPAGYPVAGPVLADRPATLVAAADLDRTHDKWVSAHNHLLDDRRPDLYRD